MTRSNFANWSVVPAKVRFLTFQRKLGDRDPILMIPYQRDGSRVREKDILR